VAPKDFKRTDAILIGHAHFDHMSDAATVAQQTGAPVVGATFGSDVLRKAGLPEKQIRTVAGGERLQFKNVTVQAALGHHNVIATTVPEGYPCQAISNGYRAPLHRAKTSVTES
jgi:L-ascorbate metabolism protein UlaG (beta-lactamase superfamily)